MNNPFSAVQLPGGATVAYTVSQWAGGFTASVEIASPTALTGWTLTWTFGAGQKVSSFWGATVTQSGSSVTATNLSYNASVPAGGTASFGFQGTWTTSNPAPTDFALNGTAVTATTTVTTGGGEDDEETRTTAARTTAARTTTAAATTTAATTTAARTTTTTSATSGTIVVDPVTRIEGHLRIQAQIGSGAVSDAWSTSPMYRGLEQILVGRDPRDAWIFTQRACGVCTTVSAVASVRAVENALGITIPDNARIMRNIMEATQYLHDHVVHFYHLHGPDWIDITSALNADPALASALQASLSSWSNNSTAYFASVKAKLATFVASGQLGPFANGYWGHSAYKLSPEANLVLTAHYLEALDWQRDAVKIHAYLGGKNPHPQTYLVGGMATPLDPTNTKSVTPATISTMKTLAASMRTFVEQVYVPDLLYLAKAYSSWTTIGQGVGNLLCVGDFPDATGVKLIPGGIIRARNLASVEALNQQQITEDLTRAWYSGSTVHPSVGVTQPNYTGPTPPYTTLNTSAKYSWSKAPRYGGTVMEVGPLARMAVAYASGVTRAKQLVDDALTQIGQPTSALFSTIGRMLARALETQWLGEQLGPWLDQLSANISAGNLAIAETSKWDPATWPATASGYGLTEAPRGALGHWVNISAGKITNYQIVIPSTWNGSPRDAAGNRGAWEQALVATPVTDATKPLEILRVVHSFDPCMACAVHVLDARGTKTAEIIVVP